VRRLHRTQARLQGGCIDATTYDAGFRTVEAVEVIARLANGEDLNGEKFLVPGRVATPQNIGSLDHGWARDYGTEPQAVVANTDSRELKGFGRSRQPLAYEGLFR
jgi:hypothetical protein